MLKLTVLVSLASFIILYFGQQATPFSINSHPKNVTKFEGQNVTLSCNVSGAPAPNVTWWKDGQQLVTTGSRLTIDYPSNSLTITKLTRTDAGQYVCKASNNISSIASYPGTIDIHLADLTILNPGENFTGAAGSHAALVCQATGRVELNVTWYRDGTEIQPSRTTVIGDVVTSKLVINNVRAKDSGEYTCVARNAMRSVTTSMSLTVNVVIQVDMGITIEGKLFSEELNNKSSPEFKNLAKIFQQEISYIYEAIPGFKEVIVLKFKNSSIAVAFRVVVIHKVDTPSDEPARDAKQRLARVVIVKLFKTNGVLGNLTLRTDSLRLSIPPPEPRNVTASEIGVDRIALVWELPEFHEFYGITSYDVQYKESANDWKSSELFVKDVKNHDIDNLQQNTKYAIRVFAVNKLGKGIPSEAIAPTTLSPNIFVFIWEKYKWLIVSAGIGLFLLLLTGIFLCCLRRKRKRRVFADQQSQSRRTYDNFAISRNGMQMAQLASTFREIPRDQILFGKELSGSGEFSGRVVRGYLREDRTHCALKMLKDSASNEDYRNLLNELEIMSSIEEHPNIVNLLGACTERGPLYIVVELAEHGCLLEYLHKNQMYSVSHEDKISLLTKVDKIRIALQVAKGLEHLARHRCAHRDLAARNVLLGTNMTPKLSDFGLVRDVYDKGYYQHLSSKNKLPVRWMAIEAIETLMATKESDVWSFGVLLWEIESGGKIPFPGLSAKEITKTLKQGSRLRQPRECSHELYAIMTSCWNANPRRRPTVENLSSVLDGQLFKARNEEATMESSVA